MLKDNLIAEWNKIFDTHEHFGSVGNYTPQKPTIDLARVFKGAYMPVPRHIKRMCEQLQKQVGTDALTSLRLAFKELYET